MRPLVLLGLARHAQQRGRRGGDALGVTGYFLRLHHHGNAALRDQTECLIDVVK
jgi:hypothetical protein